MTSLQTRAWAARLTPLDAYVHKPDPHYGFRLVHKKAESEAMVHVLEMTSQSWLTPREVHPTLWKHWLVIVVPKTVTRDVGLLFIGGGKNSDPPPEDADARLKEIATKTKTVVAELRMVPNQPLVFAGDGEPRSEDALIAYTWDRYLHTGDARWPARLPMTKSAVRAMDTITHYCESAGGGGVAVRRFVVAGGSKRGWTTWTTAAVDARVVAAIPIVIDMLNVIPSFKHHHKVYGFYAPAVHDYEQMGVMEWQDRPEYRALMDIVEPYQYRDRLRLPKMLINAADDQFFLPDSWQFYWKDLQGPKYLRYVPNADHSLKGSDAWQTLLAFYEAIVWRRALPRIHWVKTPSGDLNVTSDRSPSEVRLWRTSNPSARDFRLETIGAAWKSQLLAPSDDRTWSVKLEPPEKGWCAYLVELKFDINRLSAPLKLTTGVYVVPDVLPFSSK